MAISRRAVLNVDDNVADDAVSALVMMMNGKEAGFDASSVFARPEKQAITCLA
jgi:hypothetical protein